MTRYCLGRKRASVIINFQNLPPETLIFYKTPIDIEIEPASPPENFYCDATFGFGGRDRVVGNDYYYDGRAIFQPEESTGFLYYLKSISINNANELWIARQGSLSVSLIAEVPAQSGVFIGKTLDTPLRINPGDLIFVDRRINNGVRDLPAIFFCNYCKYPIDRWQTYITDSINRKISREGIGRPQVIVTCYGCSPNTLDCGGCCADCAELAAYANTINAKL